MEAPKSSRRGNRQSFIKPTQGTLSPRASCQVPSMPLNSSADIVSHLDQAQFRSFSPHLKQYSKQHGSRDRNDGNQISHGHKRSPNDLVAANMDDRSTILNGVPTGASISDIYSSFRKFGRPEYIDFLANFDGGPNGRARLRFEKRPRDDFFRTKVHTLEVASGTQYSVQCEPDRPRREPAGVRYTERMSVKASSIDFGIMITPTEMLIKHKGFTEIDSVSFGLNLRFEELIVEFPLLVAEEVERFRFSVPFNRMKDIKIVPRKGKVCSLLMELEDPPKYFRHVRGARPGDKAQIWSEYDTWFRQTEIVSDQEGVRSSALTLKRPHALLDLGRWTTYKIEMDMTSDKEILLERMRRSLNNFNVPFVESGNPKFGISHSIPFWEIIDSAFEVPRSINPSAATVLKMERVPFEIRYQLEVCISQGILNEHNLDHAFVEKLMTLDETSAREILENIAANKVRIFEPMIIFDCKYSVECSNSNPPEYCALVRSVTVTPTTIKFHTPTVETSNRILRQYGDHSDRFIRVRFAEEGGRSKIFPTDKNTENEVFTRIKRTFANGITVGNRKFEFLAFGNSQFREHGAYFFSPTPGLSKDDIRAWMGYFQHIKHVALFAARLGQCFSTTRAISTQARTIETPDILRNGYCFSDGVGKISPLLALIIADSIGLTHRNVEPPSVFQFRLGGCKGVLAVWPMVKGKDIHIRETQYKFPAVHEGLEIIRCSQFASANLNRQIILVLSTLGVTDHIFIDKLKSQLEDVEEAMTDPQIALKILQRDVDHNQMTLKLARMVADGFLQSREPFVKSLLQLWRAWSIKLLKEKARITISKGALLLGCLDETGKLRGHYNDVVLEGRSVEDDAKSVPEIFVQLSKGPHGTATVLTGPMLLARNPSLHPGDIRVVCGVDIPDLRHLKDCVVLPQTGDRDVASMCSGGDLDGDDFEVIWDPDLLPTEWNHPPMDYSAPAKVEQSRPITDDDLTNFFIKYMKNDSLPTIALAHVAHADMSADGVKDPKCLQLAALHSKAVDFVKTGKQATMTQDLRPKKFPHFMERKNKSKTYTSRKILGQLYDLVERIPFEPELFSPFDERVIQAPRIRQDLTERAQTLKYEYDNHMRRILAQHAIETEFEVWSTFVMQHNHHNDYKMQEEMVRISEALKDQFRKRCIDIAGGKEYEQLAPFVVEMYHVTATEVKTSIAQSRVTRLGASQMPLVSFPWLFADILGKIAKANTNETTHTADNKDSETAVGPEEQQSARKLVVQEARVYAALHEDDGHLETTEGVTHQGELLTLDFQSEQPHGESTMHISESHDSKSSDCSQTHRTSFGSTRSGFGGIHDLVNLTDDQSHHSSQPSQTAYAENCSDRSDASTAMDDCPAPRVYSTMAKLVALTRS